MQNGVCMKLGGSKTIVIVMLFVAAASSWAHKPVSTDKDADSYQTALEIDQHAVSQVFYKAVDIDAAMVWLTFEANAGEEVYFSLGIPVLERLRDYRPSLALIGPGLPDADFDFETPNDNGLHYRAALRPKEFFEPFTGTESLIIIEERVILPATGRYYLVSFHESAVPQDPKLWISIGTEERFGLKEILRLGKIRRETREFHEIEIR